MKKLISIMLAMMLALFAVPALAETAEPVTTAAVPTSATFDMHLKIGEQAQALIAPMLGSAPENAATVVNTVISIVNNLGLHAVGGANGFQAEIQLKEQPIATVTGMISETGLLVGSDLFPNSVISLSGEAMQSMMQKATESFDPEQMQEILNAILPAVTELSEKLQASMGEPEAVSMTFEDVEFTVKTPVNLTTKEAGLLLLNLVKGVLGNDSMKKLLEKIPNAADAAKKLDSTIADLEAKKDEDLPALTMAVYANEAGNTLVDIALEKDEQKLTVKTGSLGQKTVFRGEFDETGRADLTIDEAAGVLNMHVDATSQGTKVGFDLNGMLVDNMLNGQLALSMNDASLLTLEFSAAAGGEVTAQVDTEGKTEVKLESLTGSAGGESIQALSQDLMSAGLVGMLGKAMNVMPDEISALMKAMTPQTTETAPQE